MNRHQHHRITILTGHFYPFTRPSGPTTLTRNIVDELLRRKIDVTVVCYQKKNELEHYFYNGSSVYKYSPLDFLAFKRIIKKAAPSSLLILSSISGMKHLLGYYFVLSKCAPKTPITLYQTTEIPKSHQATGWPWTSLSKKFTTILAGNQSILSCFRLLEQHNTGIVFPGVPVQDIQKQYPAKSSPPKNTPFTVGFWGHIAFSKGTDLFVQIAKSCPGMNFILAAGKAQNPKDQSLYEAIKLAAQSMTNLSYIGFIKNPQKLMYQCHALLLPYRTADSILAVSMSAIEAMAMGIPVIGTQNPVLSPLISDGANGFICESSDDMIRHLTMLSETPATYNKLAAHAVKTVTIQFDIVNVVDNLLECMSNGQKSVS